MSETGDSARIETVRDAFRAYETREKDGERFRNTEIHSFEGAQICRAEVYFGWDL